MTPIDEYTVVVSSDAELRSVITGTNNYNYIYFDNNITLTDGIAIPATKPNLIIDGTYKEVRYTFTDMNSAAATNAIYIPSPGATRPTINVTMKNVDIVGRNYYGAICVIDSANAENVTTRYENINYVGCQITYNNYGNTEYIDSNITINNTTSTRSGEVGEVHKLVLGGNTTINHTFTGFNTFYFRGGDTASFTVLPDSNITINCARNLFAGDNQLATMTFGSNSTCNINAPNGMSLAISDRITDVLIDNAATLNVNRTSSGGTANLYVENSFIVNPGANVLFKSATNTSPHLYFYTTGATLSIDNPASCIFYNPSSSNFYFTATANVSLKSDQINQWNTAVANGNLSNLPTYQWIKKNKNIVEFGGTATNSSTSITSNNLDPVADVNLPTVSSLQLRTARVLSLGYFPLLNVSRIVSTATSVFGTTVPNGDLKVSYKTESATGNADAAGKFDIPMSTPFVVDDYVVVKNSNNNFLYNIVDVIVEEPGELTFIIIPDTMYFSCTNRISSSPILYGRDLTGWTMQVYDSRVYSSDWTITATINHDLLCERNGHTLPHSLVCVSNVIEELSTTTPILVYTGENNGGVEKTTDVKWDVDKGILLKFDNSVPVFIGDEYKATIDWELHE